MEIATLIGVNIKDFYYMTPYELSLHVNAYNQNKKADHESRITQAYLTAAWQRAKKMPKLEKVLKPTPKQMTADQMLKVVEGLNRAVGGLEKKTG